MKLRQYQREWRGVEFQSLPIPLGRETPADSRFYEAFYAALAKSKPDENSSWHEDKRALGIWIERVILRRRAAPRIISIGAGEAIAERVWLEKNYDVILNECQEHTLRKVKTDFPGVQILIAEAYDLAVAEKCDIATLLTVDYALTDDQLSRTFAAARAGLTQNGEIVNYSANVLTLLRFVKEMIKRYLLLRHEGAGYVMWGWMRSPGAAVGLARKAGLSVKEQWVLKGNIFKLRPKILWLLPPFAAEEMIIVFGKNA